MATKSQRSKTVKLSEQEKTAICDAVEANPGGFVTALELRWIVLAVHGGDEAEIKTLRSLGARLKRGA